MSIACPLRHVLRLISLIEFDFRSYVLPCPGISVSGMSDPFALPHMPVQAEQLAKFAEVCPHGRGLHTVVDSEVRDCLLIAPGMFSIENPE